MKVEIIKAYKSEDECIFEKEADAINQNINICIQLIISTASTLHPGQRQYMRLLTIVRLKLSQA